MRYCEHYFTQMWKGTPVKPSFLNILSYYRQKANLQSATKLRAWKWASQFQSSETSHERCYDQWVTNIYTIWLPWPVSASLTTLDILCPFFICYWSCDTFRYIVLWDHFLFFFLSCFPPFFPAFLVFSYSTWEVYFILDFFGYLSWLTFLRFSGPKHAVAHRPSSRFLWFNLLQIFFLLLLNMFF